MSSKKPKFIRTDWTRLSRLGKNRKNKQVWRRAKGKHSKIRRKRAGYPAKPEIGYGTAREGFGTIEGLIPVVVNNVNDLIKLNSKNIAIISSRVGARKRIEIIKKAQEIKMKIFNLNMEAKK